MTNASYCGCLSNNAYEYATQRKVKALNRLVSLIHLSVADIDGFSHFRS